MSQTYELFFPSPIRGKKKYILSVKEKARGLWENSLYINFLEDFGYTISFKYFPDYNTIATL